MHGQSSIAAALGAALLLLGMAGAWEPVAAQDRRGPPPPTPKKVIYDPDPLSCQPERIREAFSQHLEPFADQSPAVLSHLKVVQWQMTESSLRRCVSKGLMAPEEAAALRRELAPQASGSRRP